MAGPGLLLPETPIWSKDPPSPAEILSPEAVRSYVLQEKERLRGTKKFKNF